MARQTYYVTREQKHPLYKTRMLQAGPLELDASAARLYRKLGVELSDEAPRRGAPVRAMETAPEPVAPKAAPKKKASRRKKS